MVLRNSLELRLISCTRLSLSMVNHSRLFHYHSQSHIGVLQPPVLCPKTKIRVWTVAISFTTTEAISFDLFSSLYLDVSVQEVPDYILIII